MQLGAFSVSLNVKDLLKSKEFYEKLGFSVFGGAVEQNYLIMKNGDSLIGIFQDMFKENILTFNPGWDSEAKTLKNFDDVKEIKKTLASKGIATEDFGEKSFMLKDPDGNHILIDQHI